jgi:trehalose 6-phosphate synthase
MRTILVSNRIVEPRRGAAMPGGLAAALQVATEKYGAWWIGSSDKHTRDAKEQTRFETPINIAVAGKGRLITVDFPPSSYQQFYNGMANSVLWPILHDRADLLRYDPDFLAAYHAINDAMAGAVTRIAEPDSLIWVHDYHYFTLGQCLRRQDLNNPIGFFLHTPFPTASVLSCLPSNREIMKCLSAYDLIGFQTSADLLRFRHYATSELAATMIGQMALNFGSRRVNLGVFPIGIDSDRFAAAAQRIGKTRRLARMRRDLHDGSLVIGVDRLDYTKGLPLRFKAYERFLTLFPTERKRVSFLQITPPTRSEVECYRNFRAELASTAGDINARFGGVDWTVLRYLNEGFSPEELAGFYRLSKAGCVTPLRDGMNLVAKEYVAAQDPENPGVLVLSKFAGAAQELNAAIIVNPYDTDEVARGLQHALHMPLTERLERWQTLDRILRKGSLQGWYDSFLVALRTASIRPADDAALNVA